MSDTARKILGQLIAEGCDREEGITITIRFLMEFEGLSLPQAWDEVFGVGGWQKMKEHVHSILTGSAQ